ncbi:MAG: DUF721 domain-containing protein [Opitutaceae bacterium]|nr:DUF721 domain-containing protein [Opitutaceae bacterium]
MPDAPFQFSRVAEEMIGDLRQIPLNVPRRQIKRRTKGLAEVMDELLEKYKIGRDSPEQAIRERWPDLVGRANASYSHPVSIERGRLLVLVSHAVVRSELFHHREAIAEKIRQIPGCKEVRNLNLRAG